MLLFLFYYIIYYKYSQYIKNIGISLFIVDQNEGKHSSCCKSLFGQLMRISNAKLSIVFTSQLSEGFPLGPKQLLSDGWSHFLSFQPSFSISTWAKTLINFVGGSNSSWPDVRATLERRQTQGIAASLWATALVPEEQRESASAVHQFDPYRLQDAHPCCKDGHVHRAPQESNSRDWDSQRCDRPGLLSLSHSSDTADSTGKSDLL
jgi:hypothetical protein